MSDSPDASTTAAAAAASDAAGQATAVGAAGPDTKRDATGPDAGSGAPKPPARPAAEVRADIVKERAALGASFDALRADLDDAVDAGRKRVADVGHKAKIAAPVAAVAVAVALFLRSRARRRR